MTDFTIVNPKRDPFRTGVNINQAFEDGLCLKMGMGTKAGEGVLVTFTSDTVEANGRFDLGVKGTFNITIKPEENNFAVKLDITGSPSGYSREFLAAASVDLEKHSVTLVDVSDKKTYLSVVREDGASIPRISGKIVLNPSWIPPSLYISSYIS